MRIEDIKWDDGGRWEHAGSDCYLSCHFDEGEYWIFVYESKYRLRGIAEYRYLDALSFQAVLLEYLS